MTDDGVTTSGRESEFAALRARMVDNQLRPADVNNADVLAAFLATPREKFVAAAAINQAYLDRNVLAAGAANREILAPRTLARLLQAATPQPGERALDVGGGSGYASALLIALGCEATLLESDAGALAAARAALAGAASAVFVEGDLAAGAPRGPFDLILVNGAYEKAPLALIDRLAEGGRLVGLDASSGAQRAVVIEKSGASYSERALFYAAADVLPGFERAASFAF